MLLSNFQSSDNKRMIDHLSNPSLNQVAIRRLPLVSWLSIPPLIWALSSVNDILRQLTNKLFQHKHINHSSVYSLSDFDANNDHRIMMNT
ncbi:hypothetical protein BBBOND_0303280 [Babesia bigemina]|uniref:Uncharacterized protein n=1 Tax=Babesia bigemina TaxID=5866 RepID=A0A061DBZ9_BABBI|nr:hypothetical protein BBBOND_0303280 [Babesia bigemina]CDR96424.1 hypothetical protein BBBOND_0303280 [Babesia bigemina]|eukprot:XP_012768610.1 hypothetical protein BBBOND_0303280 [Babesia bigemina]